MVSTLQEQAKGQHFTKAVPLCCSLDIITAQFIQRRKEDGETTIYELNYTVNAYPGYLWTGKTIISVGVA